MESRVIPFIRCTILRNKKYCSFADGDLEFVGDPAEYIILKLDGQIKKHKILVENIVNLCFDKGGCSCYYPPESYFPTRIFAPFSRLTTLEVGCNDLENIEELPESLLKLDCSHNNIKSFTCLPKLKKLNCSFNPLVNFQGIPDSVEWLNISGTKIDSLQDIPKKCNVLICEFCPIKSLNGCDNIEYLSCIYTNITDLQGLNNDCKTIDCSNNKQLTSLKGCPYNLKNLICEYNVPNIKDLENVPRNINSIDVKGTFSSFDLRQFPQLQYVAVFHLPKNKLLENARPKFVITLPYSHIMPSNVLYF
jgi:hypothetical protein